MIIDQLPVLRHVNTIQLNKKKMKIVQKCTHGVHSSTHPKRLNREKCINQIPKLLQKKTCQNVSKNICRKEYA